jgi:hypothetical protein
VEEATAATQSLQQQAKELVGTVSAFQLHVQVQQQEPIAPSKSVAAPARKNVNLPTKKTLPSKPPLAKPVIKTNAKPVEEVTMVRSSPSSRPAAVGNEDWEEF